MLCRLEPLELDGFDASWCFLNFHGLIGRLIGRLIGPRDPSEVPQGLGGTGARRAVGNCEALMAGVMMGR